MITDQYTASETNSETRGESAAVQYIMRDDKPLKIDHNTKTYLIGAVDFSLVSMK